MFTTSEWYSLRANKKLGVGAAIAIGLLGLSFLIKGPRGLAVTIEQESSLGLYISIFGVIVTIVLGVLPFVIGKSKQKDGEDTPQPPPEAGSSSGR